MLIDAPRFEVHWRGWANPRHDDPRPLVRLQRLVEFDFPVAVNAFDRRNHIPSITRSVGPPELTVRSRSLILVRRLSLLALGLCSGCGPKFVYYNPPAMTPDQMLERSTLAFVGVIERQEFERWPFFRFEVPGDDPSRQQYWRILRRDVRVEFVARGTEERKRIPVYEVFWVGGTSGDWNSTQDGERDLFLVRNENGYYHVVRDWSRSIHRIGSGPHARMPLDDSRPFWERVALLNWWVTRNDPAASIVLSHRTDPGNVLGLWRRAKLARGLMRHPSSIIRVRACVELLNSGYGQDECWDELSESERTHLQDGGSTCCTAADVASKRNNENKWPATVTWQRYTEIDSRRLFTAMSNRPLRAEFCKLWHAEYPQDHDNGCPADQPPPATIVTDQGEVPL